MTDAAAQTERNILFVDDEPRNHERFPQVVCMMLESSGVEIVVISAYDADEGLAMLTDDAEPPIAGIIVDGLWGEWTRIVDRANELSIPALVRSGMGSEVEKARAAGTPALVRGGSMDELRLMLRALFLPPENA